MARTWITVAQLRNRLSTIDLTRFYDDNKDGNADTGTGSPVEQLREDATSKVASYLQGIVNGGLAAVDTAVAAGEAHEVVRLTLDVAAYMAVARHPSAAPDHDWVEMKKGVDADMKMLRQSFTKLDTDSAPNEPSNVGGTIYPEVDSTASNNTFRVGGFGDF